MLVVFTPSQFWPSGVVVACVFVCLHLFVCLECICLMMTHVLQYILAVQCVSQSWACLCVNSWSVQAKISQFWSRIPIVLRVDWLWSSRTNLSLKSKSTPFLACLHVTCLPFQLECINFDQKCKTHHLRSLKFWGLIDLDLQGKKSKLILFHKNCPLGNLLCLEKTLWLRVF